MLARLVDAGRASITKHSIYRSAKALGSGSVVEPYANVEGDRAADFFGAWER